MTKIQGINSSDLAPVPSSPLMAISILKLDGWWDTWGCYDRLPSEARFPLHLLRHLHLYSVRTPQACVKKAGLQTGSLYFAI
jgi:hypothetical protein